MGLLKGISKQIWQVMLGHRSWKEVVSSVYTQVDSFLIAKYTPMMLRLKEQYKQAQLGESAPIVWCCWLQGFEQAPPLVQACFHSLCRHINDREIVCITQDNYHQYITLPADIEAKYKAGRIPPALFSDLIRLELLIRHGGTWIDATVLCMSSDYPATYLSSDLFMYRYRRKDGRGFAGISNWFITARSNHPVLLILRDLLYQYWRDYDCVIEYYMFHRLFGRIVREYPDVLEQMVPGFNPAPLRLVRLLGERFDERLWTDIRQESCFQKLIHRTSADDAYPSDSFYSEILRRYSH